MKFPRAIREVESGKRRITMKGMKLLTGSLALVLATGASAFAQDQLRYSKSYTVVGDYAAAGVDVRPSTAVNGFVKGTISMNVKLNHSMKTKKTVRPLVS